MQLSLYLNRRKLHLIRGMIFIFDFVAEIAASNPRFRRMYRFVPMISAEENSLPKDRRCLRFKCNSFYELNAVTRC